MIQNRVDMTACVLDACDPVGEDLFVPFGIDKINQVLRKRINPFLTDDLTVDGEDFLALMPHA